MRGIWVITKRELASYFDSLIALLLIVIFLVFSGFFTWLYNAGNIFLRAQADLQVFFGISFWTLFFFIPAITMRTLAEENKTGTIELLSTKAVSDWQIVVGKFLSSLLLLVIALACTIPYYITVARLGNIDHGATTGGYFGLLLMSAMYVSIGIFASSLTNNQIIALLLALVMGFFFPHCFRFAGIGLHRFCRRAVRLSERQDPLRVAEQGCNRFKGPDLLWKFHTGRAGAIANDAFKTQLARLAAPFVR
jgi:ABC-2 type transport system permease protein